MNIFITGGAGYIGSATAEALITLKKVVALEAPPVKLKGAEECLRILFAFWRHALENRLPANEALIQGLSTSTGPVSG